MNCSSWLQTCIGTLVDSGISFKRFTYALYAKSAIRFASPSPYSSSPDASAPAALFLRPRSTARIVILAQEEMGYVTDDLRMI
jgi:hypothetical protein